MNSLPDSSIDLRGTPCPLNFVKTKLKLEELNSGQILEVFLDDGEPILNLPRSIKEEGNEIIRVQREQDGSYRLLIKKKETLI